MHALILIILHPCISHFNASPLMLQPVKNPAPIMSLTKKKVNAIAVKREYLVKDE